MAIKRRRLSESFVHQTYEETEKDIISANPLRIKNVFRLIKDIFSYSANLHSEGECCGDEDVPNAEEYLGYTYTVKFDDRSLLSEVEAEKLKSLAYTSFIDSYNGKDFDKNINGIQFYAYKHSDTGAFPPNFYIMVCLSAASLYYFGFICSLRETKLYIDESEKKAGISESEILDVLYPLVKNIHQKEFPFFKMNESELKNYDDWTYFDIPDNGTLLHDNRNSDGQEVPETGAHSENVYLKDCPFMLGKQQVEFFKMMQDAKEKHTITTVDDYMKSAKNESLATVYETYASVLNESFVHQTEEKDEDGLKTDLLSAEFMEKNIIDIICKNHDIFLSIDVPISPDSGLWDWGLDYDDDLSDEENSYEFRKVFFISDLELRVEIRNSYTGVIQLSSVKYRKELDREEQIDIYKYVLKTYGR